MREGTKKSIHVPQGPLSNLLDEDDSKGDWLSSVPTYYPERRISMETILIVMLIALIAGLLVGVTVARPALR